MASIAHSTGFRFETRADGLIATPYWLKILRPFRRTRADGMCSRYLLEERSAIHRFSITVSDGMEPEVREDEAQPEFAELTGMERKRDRTAWLTQSSPASGVWKPASTLMSVDFPEPFSPSKP